jgi:hypothetical protein
VNHVVLWSTDFIAVEKAQMIGRCGRHQLGFALLRQRDPPSNEAVVKSIASPLPTVDRDVFVWRGVLAASDFTQGCQKKEL